jgi:hypothetical protein
MLTYFGEEKGTIEKKLLQLHVCATFHLFRQPRALGEVALGMHAMMENGSRHCCLLAVVSVL